MEEMNNQLFNFVAVVCSLTLSTEKHEIYATAFGSNLFYDLILQGPLGALPSGSTTGCCHFKVLLQIISCTLAVLPML